MTENDQLRAELAAVKAERDEWHRAYDEAHDAALTRPDGSPEIVVGIHVTAATKTDVQDQLAGRVTVAWGSAYLTGLYEHVHERIAEADTELERYRRARGIDSGPHPAVGAPTYTDTHEERDE